MMKKTAINPAFSQALRIIHDHLRESQVDWAITGSLGFALHGVEVAVHDIDLQTDAAGAYAIEERLSEFIVQKVAFRSSANMQSYFGVLQIGATKVEIMGALQQLQEDDQWEAPVDIRPHREWHEYDGMRLPLLSLTYEHQAYLKMGRFEKARLLEKYLSLKESNSMSEPSDHHGPAKTPQGQYPNETMRLLLERASLRSYTDEKIPEDVLRLVLEAGNHAATGGNLQPYSIIRIEAEKTRKWLAKRCEQGFIAKAPVNLVFCIDMHRNQRWARLEVAPYTALHAFRHFWIAFQDTIIAAQNICTAADAMGLGSVYIGTIIEILPELREQLKLPEGVFPVVLLCLGYPKKKPEPRGKLGVDVLVHNETYQELDDEALLAAYNRKYAGTTYQATPERLETIEKVCLDVHGEEFAQKCIENIKQKGHISPVVRYFGLHYLANVMPANNPGYLKTLEEAGFDWMKEFKGG